MEAVGKTAEKVVEEVRRQFREIKGIMEGTANQTMREPWICVTKAALQQMRLPALLPVVVPILGFFPAQKHWAVCW